MTEATSATGVTAAPQMPTPAQLRQELLTYNLGTEVMVAFDSFIAQNNINPNEPMTQESALRLMEALDKAAPRPTVVAPPAPESSAPATDRVLPAREPASREIQSPTPQAGTPSAVYSDKAFRKDTPQTIREKAANGTLAAEEAKMWATTTTKEGRKILFGNDDMRMDDKQRKLLVAQHHARKRAARGETSEATPKSDGSFMGRAARGIANAVTWPVRGLMKLFGDKNAAEKLRLAQPPKASQVSTSNSSADKGTHAPESIEDSVYLTPEPKIETKPLPAVQDEVENPKDLLEPL